MWGIGALKVSMQEPTNRISQFNNFEVLFGKRLHACVPTLFSWNLFIYLFICGILELFSVYSNWSRDRRPGMNSHNGHKFSLCFACKRNWDISVGIGTGFRLRSRGILIRFPAELKYLTLFHSPSIGSFQLSIQWDLGGLSLRGESLVLSLKMNEVSFPLHFLFSAYVRGATRTNLPFLHLGKYTY